MIRRLSEVAHVFDDPLRAAHVVDKVEVAEHGYVGHGSPLPAWVRVDMDLGPDGDAQASARTQNPRASIPPAVTCCLVHALAPPVGSCVTKTESDCGAAIQNVVLGHEMLMKKREASRLALFPAPAPPVGSEDVTTPPWV